MNPANLKQMAVTEMFRCVPAGLLARCAGNGLIIPYYHMISNQEVLHIKNLYSYKTEKEFTDDLDFLLKHFRPLNLFDVIELTRNSGSLRGPSFLLTFDDGFREMADVVMPILLKKGVPAAFFPGSAFVDNRSLCYDHKKSLVAERLKNSVSRGKSREINRLIEGAQRNGPVDLDAVMAIDYRHRELVDRIAEVLSIDFQDYLARNSPYLSSESIRRMINCGLAIGAHSIDHPLYSRIPLEEQVRQTEVSVSYIRNNFGLDYGAFAFPHGDGGVGAAFFRKMQSGGLVDISFGTGGLMRDPIGNSLQRVSFEKPLMPGELVFRLAVARRMYRTLLGRGVVKRE